MENSEPVWVPVPGFPDYAMTNNGRFKRIVPDACNRPMRELRPVLARTGRHVVSLCRDRKVFPVQVAAMVAQTFIGDRPQGMLCAIATATR